MSQWLVNQYMAVDLSAFCAFGIQARKEGTAFFYDLWGVTHNGSQSVLAVHVSLEKAQSDLMELTEMATGKGD